MTRRNLIVVVFLLPIAIYSVGLFWPPKDFPVNQPVAITNGSSLDEISETLSQTRAIKSKTVFRNLIKLSGLSGQILAGDYWFEKPLSVLAVARRLLKGEFSANPIKLTIPEGLKVGDMAKIFARNLPDFNQARFLDLATPLEGRLFPDTYFIPPLADAKEVVKLLAVNFEQRLKGEQEVVSTSGRSLDQILILASILEKEANDYRTRQLIAGILWKRLDANMPLQVDVAPTTYKVKGLPPAPINNPGLEAIRAALHSEASPYWFYLSSPDGETHYARNFDEHKTNKARYL